MRVAFGSDHAGWLLRARILETLRERGDEVIDCGPPELVQGDDYPEGIPSLQPDLPAGENPHRLAIFL
jgi:ribose 5-phosphate isomerase RpiB